MTAEVCPYCRAPIIEDEPLTVCEGCGTRHHADCYAENAGCTIFGCRCAPADEPKLSVSTPELVAVAAPVAQATTAARPLAPPSPGSMTPAPATVEELRQIANRVVPSMFGSFSGEATQVEPEQAAPSKPRSRTTFIVLGALLGPLGAHNFYAGYHKKGAAQVAITVLTMGFGIPMSWIWAIIDVCTVGQDKQGVQFEA